MGRAGRGRVRAVVLSLVATLALSGCTIPFINVELPFDLPSFEFPFNLEELDIDPIKLPIGVTTSVDEARMDTLSGKTTTLSDESLVMPGYLTVGLKTATSSAPLCVEGEYGSVYGLDVDVAAALASEMGLWVRYVPVTDWAQLGVDCDVIMDGSADNPEERAIVGTYVESATSFFYRGDTTVLAPTDLNGKSVGIQSGSVSETVLNRTGLKMSQKPYASLNEAFDALSAGEVDFVLCEAYPGAYLASLHPGTSFAGALEAPETAGVAVKATNSALVAEAQSAFDRLVSNGVLDLCRTHWVGSMPALTTDSQIQNVPAGDSKASQTAPAESTNEESIDEAGSNAITNV